MPHFANKPNRRGEPQAPGDASGDLCSGASQVVDGLLRQLGNACEELRWELESLREENALLRKSLGNGIANGGGGQLVSPKASDSPLRNDALGSEIDLPKEKKKPPQSDQVQSEGNELSQFWRDFHKENTLSGLVASRSSVGPLEVDRVNPIEVYSGLLQKFISYPGSHGRLIWDIVGVTFIFYDLILIPLRAFSPPETWLTIGMDWTTLLYWTLNVVASVQVGFVEHGITIMNPFKILLHYLKTWFILDIVVVVPDWYFTILTSIGQGSTNNPEDAVKLLRMLRLSKCLRLLRAAKLKQIMQHINDMIASEYTAIAVSIIKMILLLLLVNHYIASFWYIVGSMSGQSKNWVDEFGFSPDEWFQNYCLSLHWSITQFTPASKVGIQPQNIVERCFAILIVIFALVGFSYILGSITGSLAQLRAIAEDASKQFWQVRRYLRQNNVSQVLGTRIVRYLEHAYTKSKKRVEASNIRIMALLSDSLRSELRLEVALPQVKAHPLFLKLSFDHMQTLRRIATTCIHYQNLAHADVLFYPGEMATHMYFLITGLMKYTIVANGRVNSEWVEGNEDWIAEPVLWLNTWVHRGTPVATTDAEIACIAPKKFAEMVCLNPSGYDLVTNYARGWLTWLNTQDQLTMSDIYQGERLFKDFSNFCDLHPAQVDQQLALRRAFTLRS